MDKETILQLFLQEEYPQDSLFAIYKLAYRFTEEHLIEPISEIIFRHIYKDSKQIANATKCTLEEAVQKLINIRKI